MSCLSESEESMKALSICGNQWLLPPQSFDRDGIATQTAISPNLELICAAYWCKMSLVLMDEGWQHNVQGQGQAMPYVMKAMSCYNEMSSESRPSDAHQGIT